MLLTPHASITKFHALGHHSGASIAVEMAVKHPDRVLSITLCGPALLTKEEQDAVAPIELVMFNAPAMDGSHLIKSWEKVIAGGLNWELTTLHGQVLDTVRAYEGRVQIYTCVFAQPMIELLGKVSCPVLGMSSEKDMLYSYLPRVKETVSLHVEQFLVIH
jgi:pimeloyl-ACP methyl ester carboxylesterase